jgi:radical SAM superfamily enzyme YgiQ (UPF0313 family)
MKGYYSTALYILRDYAAADPEIKKNYQFKIINEFVKVITKKRFYQINFIEFLHNMLKVFLTFNIRKIVRWLKNELKYNSIIISIVNMVLWWLTLLRIYFSFPDIIGFSCAIWNVQDSIRMAEWLKKTGPNRIVLFGGLELTNSGPEFIKHYPFIDFVIDGEGEATFKELLLLLLKQKKQEITPISGLVIPGAEFKKREPLTDFDNVPSPYLGLLQHQKMVKTLLQSNLGCMIEASRGCPFKCSYCFEAERFQSVRNRSIENIREEIEHVTSYGVRKFHILDPVLCNSNSRRLKQIAGVIRQVNGHEEFIISVEVYADYLTAEMLDDLDVFYSFDIGLQTINPYVLKKIKRVFNQVRFTQGVSLLKRLKRKVVALYLIFGLPGESYFSFLKSILYMFFLNPDFLYINKLCVLQGTPLRRNTINDKLEFSQLPPYYIISSPDFTEMEIDLCNCLVMSLMKEFSAYQTRSELNA